VELQIQTLRILLRNFHVSVNSKIFGVGNIFMQYKLIFKFKEDRVSNNMLCKTCVANLYFRICFCLLL